MTDDLRTALVFTPRMRCTEDLMDSLGRQPWATCAVTASGFVGRGRGLELRFDFARTARQALDRLASSYYNLVVVDCRHLPGLRPSARRATRTPCSPSSTRCGASPTASGATRSAGSSPWSATPTRRAPTT